MYMRGNPYPGSSIDTQNKTFRELRSRADPRVTPPALAVTDPKPWSIDATAGGIEVRRIKRVSIVAPGVEQSNAQNVEVRDVASNEC